MVTAPPLRSVVPPLTDTLARAVVPTAALKVVVPLLVTVRAYPPSTVPVKVVLLVVSLTVRPLPRVKAFGNVTAPVLVMVSVPPAVSERPLTDNVPVLVRLTFPLPLLVALNVATAFDPFRVVPPTELVVTVPPESVIAPLPDSVIVPPLVSDTFPLSETAPVMGIVSALVLPVFTLIGTAEAPPVPVKVKLFVPLPSVTEMEVTAEAGTVSVALPLLRVIEPAPAPVGAPNCRPPVSVKT